MTTEKPCSDHPDAPHGFDRNGSHMAGHYVCECSGWVPPSPLVERFWTPLQERLRNPRAIEILTQAAEEAADRIDLDAALRHRILLLLADRYQHSHGSFCTKLGEILEESQ